MNNTRMLLCLLFIGFAGLTGCADTDFFIRFAGDAVTLEEYRLFAADGVALVSADYAAKYGADSNTAEFWTTDYDGRTPLADLQDYANAELREQKGLQALAKERHILPDTSFSYFQSEFAAYNDSRAAGVSRGEVVYGPIELSLEQYYSYRQSGLTFLVQEQLEQDIPLPPDNELEQFYNQLLLTENRKNFTADVVYFWWDAKDNQQDAAIAAALQDALLTETPEAAADAVQAAGMAVQYSRAAVNTRDIGKEDSAYQAAADAVRTVEAGECSALPGSLLYVERKTWETLGTFAENRVLAEYEYRVAAAKQIMEKTIAKYPLDFGAQYQRLTAEDLLTG